MALGLIRMRHRWGFVTDQQLAEAAEKQGQAMPNALPTPAQSSTLALVGLRDRLSAQLFATNSEETPGRSERPLLLAADAGTGLAPQLLQAFQPAWRGCASAGHEWQLARALFPAEDDQARLVLAVVDAPKELAVTMRLDRYPGQAIPAEQRFLLAAPVGGQEWREWHILLPVSDQLALDQLLRRPLILDWSLSEPQDAVTDTDSSSTAARSARGKIVCELYRDFPFLDQ